MLKVYTDKSHYIRSNRKFLIDLLRPYIPSLSVGLADFSDFEIEIVENIENSDICLLPLYWNYYLSTNKVVIANQFIEKAKIYNKKVLIGVSGDYFIPLPNCENIIGMYTSLYKSFFKSNYISIPIIISDPLEFLKKQKPNDIKFNKTPVLGFCGHIDSSKIISILKMLRLIYKKILFYLKLDYNFYGPILPATYLRRRVLDYLESSEKINTLFVRRNKYQAGVLKETNSFQIIKKEFYQNILDTHYTICIRGTGNFSARFYETLALGRIPVFIDTDCVLPFNNVIDWEKHIIIIKEISEIEKKILDFHDSHTDSSIREVQYKNRKLWKEYFSFKGAMRQLIFQLNKQLSLK